MSILTTGERPDTRDGTRPTNRVYEKLGGFFAGVLGEEEEDRTDLRDVHKPHYVGGQKEGGVHDPRTPSPSYAYQNRRLVTVFHRRYTTD